MAIRPPISPGQWINSRAELLPMRPALTFQGTTWTYREFVEQIDRLAGALHAQGVRQGDRVGFLAFNHSMFLVALFATSKLGAIYVPLNFRLTGAELEFIINDAGVHTLIVGPDHQSVLEPVRGALKCQRFFGFGGHSEAWPDIAREMERATPVHAAAEMDPDDVAILIYTSGTTGRPKGSMMTVGNIWATMVNEMLMVDVLSTDTLLTYAPLFHVGGLNVLTMTTILKGAHVVLHQSFDPGQVIADIARYKVTLAFAVPAMLLFISQHPDFEKADMSTLRSVSVGGFGTREQLFAGYEAAGGTVDPQRVRFWEVFGTLKWGVICEGMAESYQSGDVRTVERAAVGRRASEAEIDLLVLLQEDCRHA